MLGLTRKNIRAGLLEALNSISTVGGRVSSGEVALGIGLPNITYNIETENYNTSGGYMVNDDDPGEREIKIIIEGRALLRDGTEVPIDDLCLEIEKEIASGSTLNQWCNYLTLETTTYDLAEDDKPIGLVTLEYVGYYIEGVV